MSLLEVHDLSITFENKGRSLRAVDSISFSVDAGKTLTLVGESGCGKSLTSYALMRLLTKKARVSGKILFNGCDLNTVSENKMRDIRGAEIAMIFQEPMTALNPVFTIGNQIEEVISQHQKTSRLETRRLCLETMKKVGISDAEERYEAYPHQLSGGLRQRAMIAMALACRPKVLIADEPTTALDVTLQLQILNLIKELQRESGMALILITHDFGVVAETADDVAVMYAGRIVERGKVRDIFNHPRHPYTLGLQRSMPGNVTRESRLYNIPGLVPSLGPQVMECRFHERCSFATDECRRQSPLLVESHADHFTACHHPQDGERSQESGGSQV